MKRFIVVRTQFQGVHCYPNAPDRVEFLRSPHRHVFNVEAQIEVFHDDRELEFFIVKESLDRFIHTTPQFLEVMHTYQSTMSCEQMAALVKDHLHALYGSNRLINVAVFEDDQNGALLREDL